MTSQELLDQFWAKHPLYDHVYIVTREGEMLYWSSKSCEAEKWLRKNGGRGRVTTLYRSTS